MISVMGSGFRAAVFFALPRPSPRCGIGGGGTTLRKKMNAAIGYDSICNRIGEGYLIDEPKD